MRRDLEKVKAEAEKRGFKYEKKQDLIQLSLLFALEDLIEKVNIN